MECADILNCHLLHDPEHLISGIDDNTLFFVVATQDIAVCLVGAHRQLSQHVSKPFHPIRPEKVLLNFEALFGLPFMRADHLRPFYKQI